MKRLALLALVGSAISFALPTFAQQKDTITDPQIVDQLKHQNPIQHPKRPHFAEKSLFATLKRNRGRGSE
jgi:hypothetical protein